MNSNQIGKRIKMHRIQQKKTQQEVADACSFSKSLLSKIESGIVTPTLGNIAKIADFLQVNITYLIGEGTNEDYCKDPKDVIENSMIKFNKGYYAFPFDSTTTDKKMQPFYYVVHKNEFESYAVAHKGEEFLYILEGEMFLEYAGKKIFLQPGDGFYFNAAYEHRTIPISDTVKLINVFV